MVGKTIGFLISICFINNVYLETSLAADREPLETQKMTVARYLKVRLEELGLKRIFGVAGNYTAPFLDTIIEDRNPDRIKITGTSNELCAGYAADGYARIQGKDGLGAVAVTYGVGAFSLLNAVAGSFVEQVPVVVINGAPTNKEFSNQRSVGLLYSHMMPDIHSNIDVYRRVTVAAERIVSANEAPLKIDAVLISCIKHRQPVYLEILEDVWRAECAEPAPSFNPRSNLPDSITRSNVATAIDATMILVREHANKGKAKPTFWAGIEIQRLGLQDDFESLLEKSGLDYTTTTLGKSLISEDHLQFRAVGLPINASCVIGLGAWTTGKDVGNRNILGDRDKVLVSQGNAFVGGAFFPNVPLGDFIAELQIKLEEANKGSSPPAERAQGEELAEFPKSLDISDYQPALLSKSLWASSIYSEPALLMEAQTDTVEEMNYESFFKTLNNQWIKDCLDTTVVVDASFPLIAAQQGLHIKARDGFVAQASWLSIGYAAPAAVGIKCAIDDKGLGNKRLVVIAGDGAFQETCQAVSSYIHLKQNTVVFVLDNGIYGIEQKLVNPNPFRTNLDDFSSPKEVYEYNKLCRWNYMEFVKVFGGGVGHRVDTVEQLREVIGEICSNAQQPFVIHVSIPQLSIPPTLMHSLAEPGEDEIDHKEWPPEGIF